MNDELPPLPEPPNGMWWDSPALVALQAYGSACAVAAVAKEREKAATMLNMTRAQASLAYGEMTMQEWRTLSSALAERADAIRKVE